MAEEICHRLHFSNEETKQILALVANHMRFGDVKKIVAKIYARTMEAWQEDNRTFSDTKKKAVAKKATKKVAKKPVKTRKKRK